MPVNHPVPSSPSTQKPATKKTIPRPDYSEDSALSDVPDSPRQSQAWASQTSPPSSPASEAVIVKPSTSMKATQNLNKRKIVESQGGRSAPAKKQRNSRATHHWGKGKYLPVHFYWLFQFKFQLRVPLPLFFCFQIALNLHLPLTSSWLTSCLNAPSSCSACSFVLQLNCYCHCYCLGNQHCFNLLMSCPLLCTLDVIW